MIIKNNMYNGKVELLFDTLKHEYRYNGKIIPGSTLVLSILAKPALLFWSANCASDYWRDSVTPGKALDELEINTLWENAKKAHTQKKNDAATIGSFVHRFAERYIKGEKPEIPVNRQMKQSVEKFLGWVKDHKVRFLVSEQPIFSQKYKYAGTLDFICEIDGKMWIGDLKTSKEVYHEYFAQVSSYLAARTEEFPKEKYAGAVIVRVGKDDGEIEVVKKTSKELVPYFELFVSCLATYNNLSKLGMLQS